MLGAEHLRRSCVVSKEPRRVFRRSDDNERAFVHRSLITPTATYLVNRSAVTRLDYCNSSLTGVRMNVAARLIFGCSRCDPASDLPVEILHWLGVPGKLSEPSCEILNGHWQLRFFSDDYTLL